MKEAGRDPNWRVVVDAIADPALVVDRRGIVLHFNPLLIDIFPRARTGASITTLSRDPGLLQAVQNAAGNDGRTVVSLHDRVPVERRFSAILTALATEDLSLGEPAQIIVFRDLTDQEKHAQLRADFVANASHELRTPLASMKAMVETLQGAARKDEAARERFLAMLATQADRMTRLIDDLMSLNRVEMRAHLSPRDTVDVVELLEFVVQTLEPLAESAAIKLEMARPEAPLKVCGERDELSQVFLNLVQNGIRYGRAGGRVVISFYERTTRVAGRMIAVTVADTGIGIAEEHIPRLTERFYRVSAVASREKGGTGLGLAIVKHIVSRHRGDLAIESELGKGSKFTVSLPAVTAER
jgi:two-component system, OmpR family, phosphate regulon sensor histidine kinase PhoR